MDVISVLFFLFALVTVFAATRVITARNPVHSALFLVLTFVSSAAIWLLMKAEFLAIVLVLAAAGTGFALWHAHRSGPPAPSPTPQVKMVKVPAVKGLSKDGAISTLKNAGLTAEVKHTKSDRDTANQVLKQNPEALSLIHI